jgi:hypothetical protein
MRPKKITVTEPIETMKLVEYANRHGLKKAAKKYGTSPGRLSIWIRGQGFEMVREYRKKVVQS